MQFQERQPKKEKQMGKYLVAKNANRDKDGVVDYHLFCTKETPKELRDKLFVGEYWVNAVTCLICNDYVRSRNKHDFRSCKCGNVSVDGGSHYPRVVYKTEKFETHYEFFSDVKEKEKE